MKKGLSFTFLWKCHSLVWLFATTWTVACQAPRPWNSPGQNTKVGQFSSVHLLSHVRLFVTPWAVARQASLSITNSQSLLKLMSIVSVMPSNHLILCHPLFLPPSISLSIRVFSNESVLLIRWQKYWSFSFNISPSNEYSELISFRMDWLDLLMVQGTLKSLFQHCSLKAVGSCSLLQGTFWASTLKKKKWRGGRGRCEHQRERTVVRSGDLSSREADLGVIFPETVMLLFIHWCTQPGDCACLWKQAQYCFCRILQSLTRLGSHFSVKTWIRTFSKAQSNKKKRRKIKGVIFFFPWE